MTRRASLSGILPTRKVAFAKLSSFLMTFGLLVLCWMLAPSIDASAQVPELMIAPTGQLPEEGLGVGAAAGDFNADGNMDLILGTYNNAGTANVGRAYIIFGDLVLHATMDLTLSEPLASDNFGITVAGIGDFNGDGIDDVAVAARYANPAGPHSGKVYIYYGSPTPDGVVDLVLLGHVASENFGCALGSAGDVNGDGHADLLVGATGEGVSAGAAYLYFGGPSPDGTADLVFHPSQSGAVFGHSVAGVGDLDGDGFDDVIVGAPYQTPSGAVYVFRGGASPDATADAVLNGYGPYAGYGESDQFGRQVAAVGDMNGDGSPDFVVGAVQNDTGGANAGQAYVFFGSPGTLIAVQPLVLTGQAPGDLFGIGVGGTGDMNGDSYADVVIGASYHDGTAQDAGRSYVYFGGPVPDAVADLIWDGEAAGDWFGGLVSGAGDLNDDGRSEVVIGATRNDFGGQNAGRAYVFSLPLCPSGPGDVIGTIVGDCTGTMSGLYGVRVDAYAMGTGDLVATTATDPNGQYQLVALPPAQYVVTVIPPCGYSAADDEVPVTITGQCPTEVDFSLSCRQLVAAPRSIGWWKHQVAVATGGNGAAELDGTALCMLLDLIEEHFNSNLINPVAVYQPPPSGLCSDKLAVLKGLLNLKGSVQMVDRARQQLAALLLNVAAERLAPMSTASLDGANISQAITHCDGLIDNPLGDYEQAKTIADELNNGRLLPAGVIPLGTASIAYGKPVQGVVEVELPAISLATAFPNPFNPRTTVQLHLQNQGGYAITIHDLRGRLVREFHGKGGPGLVQWQWDGTDAGGAAVASGVFLCSVEAEGHSATLRLSLVR